jgi:hypothetical protein
MLASAQLDPHAHGSGWIDADCRIYLSGCCGLEVSTVLDDARARRAEELVREYEQREPDTVSLIDELFTDAGMSMDALRADALAEKFDGAEKFDNIERLDRLITMAESRRNAILHEIERHRAVLGEMLRRKVVEIEADELKVVETAPAIDE